MKAMEDELVKRQSGEGPSGTTGREEINGKGRIQSLKYTKVWDIVELPEGKNSIGSRWHFTVKFGSSGKPCRHKARFVAMGFSQREGMDYKETYSPIGCLSTVRVVMNIAAQNSWQIKQLDIKTAYLNANVDADMLMKLRQRFRRARPHWRKACL